MRKHKEYYSGRRVKGVSYARIRRLFSKGKLTAADIAARADCTVARIGQVLREMGLDALAQGQTIRLQRIRARKAAREASDSKEKTRKLRERDRERKIGLQRRYSAWLDLWGVGYGVAEIARKNGVSTQVASVTIIRLRTRYGWFPQKAQRMSKI